MIVASCAHSCKNLCSKVLHAKTDMEMIVVPFCNLVRFGDVTLVMTHKR